MAGQCYAHIPTPSGKRRCPATASTYSRSGVPVCKAHQVPPQPASQGRRQGAEGRLQDGAEAGRVWSSVYDVGAHVSAEPVSLRGLGVWPSDAPPTKDEAECCNAKRDDLGRLPIGYCGPDCLRRPK